MTKVGTNTKSIHNSDNLMAEVSSISEDHQGETDSDLGNTSPIET